MFPFIIYEKLFYRKHQILVIDVNGLILTVIIFVSKTGIGRPCQHGISQCQGIRHWHIESIKYL